MIATVCTIVVATAPATPSSISLRVSGDLDSGELQTQLRLRLPGTEFTEGQQADGETRPEAYVFLSPADGGYALTLILADGRAYDRFLTPTEGDPERSVANDLASLVRAATRGDALADREGVDIPEDPTAEPTEAVAEGEGDESTTEAGLPTSQDPPPPDSGLTWGLELGMGASAALSSDPLDRSLSGRFRLGGLAEWRGGGTVAGAANLSLHAATLGVVRVGAELGGGYVWAFDRMRLPLLALARFEQPILTEPLSLRRLGAEAERLPLLWGPVVSLRPRWALGAKRSLHLGGWVDLSWLVGSNAGLGTPRIFEVADDGTRSLAARVGGPELGLGLSLTWTPRSTR